MPGHNHSNVCDQSFLSVFQVPDTARCPGTSVKASQIFKCFKEGRKLQVTVAPAFTAALFSKHHKLCI